MQQENQTISDFVRRTDVLAVRLGLNLSEIPAILGISKAMLYGYRKGSNNISNKVWIKLEEAERRSGCAPAEGLMDEGSSTNPKGLEPTKSEEFSSVLREDPVSYGVSKPPRDQRIRDAFADIRRGLDILENLLLSERK